MHRGNGEAYGEQSSLMWAAKGAVAGPPVVYQFVERDDARPDGVKMDVVQLFAGQRADGVVVGSESGLEDMADGTPEDLMLIGEGGLQGMHTLAEVAERGRHQQVEMVRHDRVGMDLPRKACGDTQDEFQEDLLGLI